MATVTGLWADYVLQLLGDMIIDADVVGDNLILTTKSGLQIDAGNVRGASAANPNAGAVSFSPANGVAATNVQAAIAELGTEKVDKTSRVGKILDGTLNFTGQSSGQPIDRAYTNVFPAGFYTGSPRVFLSWNATSILNLGVLAVKSITTTGFTVNSATFEGSSANFYWLATGP